MHPAAKVVGGKQRGRGTHRLAIDHDRPIAVVLFQPGDRGQHVGAGAVADVVEVTRRIAVGPQRNQQHFATDRGEYLRLRQAIVAPAVVAMKEKNDRLLVR